MPLCVQVEVRELPIIYSNQEETDTRVVLYLHHAALGYKNAVVRTPDTDIFVILLFHAHTINLTIYLDTGSGKHRQLLNHLSLQKPWEKTTVPLFVGPMCSLERTAQCLQMVGEGGSPEKAVEEP